MKHLLNICNINGAEVESVDVVIGGSPCQDLSVAGKRAGLDGECSGLFMEQIRIIKEMRDADKLRIERLSDTKIRGRSGTDNTSGKGGVCGDIRNTNAVSADCGEGGTTTIESGITQHGLCGAGQLVRPRYMVWENVPGAFSSNKGEDFRIVLEETARIADETAVIPKPPKGKWTTSGAIMGNGWSIAWRVFDAQFWGVPQRRRRIALVADFGGQSAPEILFEREGVSGDIAESGAEGQGVAGDAKGGTDKTECLTSWDCQSNGANNTAIFLQGNGIDRADTAETLRAQSHEAIPMVAEPVTYPGVGITSKQNASKGTPGVCHTLNQDSRNYVVSDRPVVFSFDSLSSNSMKSSNPHSGCRQVEVSKCIDTTNPDPSKNQGGMAVVHGLVSKGNGEAFLMPEKHMSLSTGGGQAGQGYPAVFDARGNGDGSIAPTMTGDHQNRVTDYTGIVAFQNTGHGWWNESDIGATVRTPCGGDSTKANLVAAVDCRNGTENPDINGTLQAKPNGGMSLNLQNTVRTHQSVRRLTPLECERLQGFPDSWTDIPPQTEVTAEDLAFWRVVWDEWDDMNGKKRHSDKQIIKWLKSEAADSARYKALGNSIALPPWRFVLSRIHKQGARTMASLFDGIGGFPKIWQELGGQTLWCSEVEPFPIAVTRYHFKEVIK
jgi:DNA (cytosine-5)-methyltransferase 1